MSIRKSNSKSKFKSSSTKKSAKRMGRKTMPSPSSETRPYDFDEYSKIKQKMPMSHEVRTDDILEYTLLVGDIRKRMPNLYETKKVDSKIIIDFSGNSIVINGMVFGRDPSSSIASNYQDYLLKYMRIMKQGKTVDPHDYWFWNESVDRLQESDGVKNKIPIHLQKEVKREPDDYVDELEYEYSQYSRVHRVTKRAYDKISSRSDPEKKVLGAIKKDMEKDMKMIKKLQATGKKRMSKGLRDRALAKAKKEGNRFKEEGKGVLGEELLKL